MFAAERRDPEVVRLLISAGADVNASEGLGRTPLMIAALVGQIDNLRILITSGADVFAKDKAGKTTISYATERKTKAEAMAVIKILRAAGVVE